MSISKIELTRIIKIFLVSMLFVRIIRGHHSALHKIFGDFYAWRLEDSPEFATYVGTYIYNDRLNSFNYTKMEERYKIADTFKYYLGEIDQSELSPRDKINYRILNDVLDTFIEGYRWSRFGSLNPLNFLEGNQLDPSHQVDSTPFYTRGDYENFLVRLENTPLQLSEYKDLYKIAIEINRTSHNVSVNRVPNQIQQLLVHPKETPFYQPFGEPLDALPIAERAKRDLRERAETAIGGVLKGLESMKDFMEMEYLPNTRTGYGVGSLDHGQDYYKACLKWHLSTDLAPEEVHQIGLREVARIKGLMMNVIKKHNFTGSISEYFLSLRNNTSLHTDSGDALLERYKCLINERINPKLDKVFKNLPKLPVKVERMPYDGPVAQFISGSEERAGIFMVNLHSPHEIGTYVMVPITLHESSPGHHTQASYALKASLPDFRRNTEFFRYYEVPFHFPFYTAYVEGWALYAESLGEELNLYQNDYELMGRYSLESFRACRLVVDTGLHYYGWDHEDAVQYLMNHTSFSRAEMMVEVDRYITWPGQACAYKIGEIKIKELRKRAEDKMGELFDIKEFHSIVLENGPMPLTILEELVDDWIANYNPLSGENDNCSDDKQGPMRIRADARQTVTSVSLVGYLLIIGMLLQMR